MPHHGSRVCPPVSARFCASSVTPCVKVVGDLLRNLRGDWGDWRAALTPDPGTTTFGRSGFFLHGGSYPGSAGCSGVGGGVFGNSESAPLLRDILSDPDGRVPVIVK